MIWLVSFPRSGNTFFRNVLYEVYGIESSTFHKEEGRTLDANFESYPVIKTHLLPAFLPKDQSHRKIVYLIRDGRDALVSIAHHRKDIVAPGSDFYNNLIEAILAREGSFFGGWSKNVRQWTERAAIVIRFEDLIADPIREVEKLRAVMDLPKPIRDKLPSFEQLKFGRPKYGAGEGEGFRPDQAKKNFRKGKTGSYKEEMPNELEELFWCQHRGVMEQFGYRRSQPIPPPSPMRILIEASKLFSNDNDGVKRYLAELVTHLAIIIEHQPNWQIDLFHNFIIFPLPKPRQIEEEYANTSFGKYESIQNSLQGYEKVLLYLKRQLKNVIPEKLYRALAAHYREGPYRKSLRKIQQKAVERKLRATFQNKFQMIPTYDLFHIPLPQHMQFAELLNIKCLVTVHDLTHKLFPEFHTPANIENAEKGMQQILSKKADVLAISKATLKDIQNQYTFPEHSCHLVYEAAHSGKFNKDRRHHSISPILKKYGLPDMPYLLCLSTIEPRKNLINTIKAFQLLYKNHPELGHALFICGKKGWKTDDLFDDDNLSTDHMHFTGFVDDQDLPVLYAHARVFCYVSFYEGFGLPMLEAMQSGIPVIYGNNSSMPEVVKNGGLPADPADVQDISNQMYRMLSDDELHTTLAQHAWERANQFSWLKTALQTLKVYEKVINS